MIVNFAERAHNHNWSLDPVIRSLLDTDFYKLLMLQFIWKHYRTTHVSFSLYNRTTSVRLADSFPTSEVIAQMEHARSRRFRKSELVWLAGNTFYGRRGIFESSLPGCPVRGDIRHRVPHQSLDHDTGKDESIILSDD